MAEKKADTTDNHLVAELRENFGKGYARRLRAAGRIPAVIYGHGTDPQHVSLPGHETMLLLRKANAILELDIAGKNELVLVKDVQKDPVRQLIEHLDLIIVKRGEKVQVEVPIHLEGESFSGTIAMQDLNTLRLEAEATHIPERITVDIEGARGGHADPRQGPRAARPARPCSTTLTHSSSTSSCPPPPSPKRLRARPPRVRPRRPPRARKPPKRLQSNLRR